MDMNWLDTTVIVSAEAAEAVTEVLSRFAPNAVAIEQRALDVGSGTEWSPDGPLEPTVSVHAYVPIDAEIEMKRRQIEEALWHLRQIVAFPEPTFSEIKPEDWENAWKEHYQVMRLGRRFVIKPSWQEYEQQSGDVILELDPGMAFGTGLHPTTQMCLYALERHLRPGGSVLDLGCGSGILAIAAAKLGARSVLGLDIDPIAVQAAHDNVMRNRVDATVCVEHGSLETIGGRAFEFALVNILAQIIIQLCAQGLADTIEPGGTVMFAGLIDAQEKEVREALEGVGLRVMERVQDGDWVGLICRRNSSTDPEESPGLAGSGT